MYKRHLSSLYSQYGTEIMIWLTSNKNAEVKDEKAITDLSISTIILHSGVKNKCFENAIIFCRPI